MGVKSFFAERICTLKDSVTGLDLPLEPAISVQEAIEKQEQLALILVVNRSWRGVGCPPWTEIIVENLRVFHRSKDTGDITVRRSLTVSRDSSDTSAKVLLPLVDIDPKGEKFLKLTILLVDLKKAAQSQGQVVAPIIIEQTISYREGLYFGVKTQDLELFLEGLAAHNVLPQPTAQAGSIQEPTRQVVQPGFGPDPVVEPENIGPNDATYVSDRTQTQTRAAIQPTAYSPQPRPRFTNTNFRQEANDNLSYAILHCSWNFLWFLARLFWWWFWPK